MVDLYKFRRRGYGDQYRIFYDNLSKDPNSLSNLDQDLPNYAQHVVPIHSLPEEWLWYARDHVLLSAPGSPCLRPAGTAVPVVSLPEAYWMSWQVRDVVWQLIEASRQGKECCLNPSPPTGCTPGAVERHQIVYY